MFLLISLGLLGSLVKADEGILQDKRMNGFMADGLLSPDCFLYPAGPFEERLGIGVAVIPRFWTHFAPWR